MPDFILSFFIRSKIICGFEGPEITLGLHLMNSSILYKGHEAHWRKHKQETGIQMTLKKLASNINVYTKNAYICIVTLFLIEIIFFHIVYNIYGSPSLYCPPGFSTSLLTSSIYPIYVSLENHFLREYNIIN